jgi:hypothetical protein
LYKSFLGSEQVSAALNRYNPQKKLFELNSFQ